MSAAPLVTFAVPAFNHAQYIRLCLDKIAEEPYPEKELVVIDDGSTDGTAEVIRAWIAEARPTFPVDFASRPNRGVSRTMNELIAKARGRYFRPCSSDDYVIPGTLAGMVAVLEQHPNKRLVFGDAMVIDQSGRKTMESALFQLYRGRRENYLSDRGLGEEVVRRWSVAGPVYLTRLDVYAEIGGYDEALKIEDWDMMLRMVARNYAVYFDKVVAAYRVHDQNSFRLIEQRGPLKSALEYLGVLEKNHRLFSGRLRRRMDYMLFQHRARVRYLQEGKPLTWIRRTVLRLQARAQMLAALLHRSFVA